MNDAKCVTPGCDKLGDRGRGLCSTCLASWHKKVKTGQTTWEELEKLGLVAHSRRGRARQSRYQNLLDEARKKAEESQHGGSAK